uniref:Uncharacterized protein n=1 Tax=Anguilla anguilla TaxID=7936 RepID=A0A0E9THU8_ANGAN
MYIKMCLHTLWKNNTFCSHYRMCMLIEVKN